MRHPNQILSVPSPKRGLMARCFLVRNSVFVKQVPFSGILIRIVVMVFAASSTLSTLIPILLTTISLSSSL